MRAVKLVSGQFLLLGKEVSFSYDRENRVKRVTAVTFLWLAQYFPRWTPGSKRSEWLQLPSFDQPSTCPCEPQGEGFLVLNRAKRVVRVQRGPIMEKTIKYRNRKWGQLNWSIPNFFTPSFRRTLPRQGAFSSKNMSKKVSCFVIIGNY